MINEELPIGTKSGCLTIIGKLDNYQEEAKKELFQYDDNTLAKIQYKTSLLDVLTIEVLYDMAVVIKAYKKIYGNCF